MSIIDRDEMGEVWPAVQPGRGPEDLGSASLTPTDPAEVRSYQTFTLTYTVGLFGLDDTGGIMLALRWVSDGGVLQTGDPKAMNYVTAKASTGVPLELFVEPYGFRPWTLALRVTVKGGFLREGDTIEVTLGDRTGGGPGMRMQTIAEAAWEIRVSVDACATGQFSEIPDRLSVPIVAGPVAEWSVVAPTLRRPGEEIHVGITALDAWGNPTYPGACEPHLSANHSFEDFPARLRFFDDQASFLVHDPVADSEDTVTFSLSNLPAGTASTSNPCVLRRGPLAAYWGDLHGQSGETVGIGTIDEYMAFARHMAHLDVCGHQGNDFQIKGAFWDRINEVTGRLNRDGEFVVFPGYEWSGNTPVGGDHNVFFRHEGRRIVRSSHAMLEDRSDLGGDAFTLDALFEALADEDCVLWSHVGGRPADVAYAHDPRLKTAVEVHSNWGTFEWILTDSLALGHRVGVVANSDGHKGRPGAGPPGATEFGAYGGLTCFLAPELTRDAIFECMRRRHHYATSGARLHLDVTARFDAPAELFERDPAWSDQPPVPVQTAMMGDIVRTGGATQIEVEVVAGAPIERIDLMDGTQTVETWRPFDTANLGRRVRVYWQGAEYRGRGRNTLWRGQISAHGGRIRQMTPVNQWNPERPLALQDGKVVFEAVTSGNFAGVDLELDSPDVTLEVDTNLVSGTVPVANLGLDDHILQAGGLERAIVVRRMPDAPRHKEHRARTILPPAPHERALWVRVTTMDGHQAWSSPIYVLPA